MKDKAHIIGIDLGTTNICAAQIRGRTPKLISLDNGKTTLPAVVNVSPDGRWTVGSTAKDLLVTAPKSTIYGAKRLVGRQFNSLVVENLKHFFPYEIVEGPEGEAAVSIHGGVTTLTEFSAKLLAHVKEKAEQSIGAPVTDAVITVPAYYNDNQRQAVKEAGAKAGFNVRRILNEPTAAALAFGFNRTFDEKILIYDLGGGTFDVSVLQISGNVFEVIATGGDSFLGGVDLDNRIIQYVTEYLDETLGLDVTQDSVAMQRIKTAAESAKIDLSLISNVVINLPCIAMKKGQPIDANIPLARKYLDEMTEDIIERTFQICHSILAEKHLSARDIDEVILVGGQSRMPLVQKKIEEHFGKPPRKGVHPDECVSIGAALLGEALGAGGSGVTLIDVLSQPIGIALSNGMFRKIIDKNSPVPISMTFRLPMPKSKDAQFLALDIFQGDQDMVVNNEYLGTLRVPVAAAGRKVEFKLNTETLLEIVIDLPEGPKHIELTTCDTPAVIREALSKEKERRQQEILKESEKFKKAEERPGFLNSIKRLFDRS